MKKQIRYVPDRHTSVTLSADSIEVLTHNRAVAFITMFNESSWNSYDEITSSYVNVTIITVDDSRPEGYKCSCMANRKEFTCCHSLAIAMIRGTMAPLEEARVHLLGRKHEEVVYLRLDLHGSVYDLISTPLPIIHNKTLQSLLDEVEEEEI